MEKSFAADRQCYYQKNIERMAFALSISDEEMALGYQHHKVLEMSRLLTIASDFWNEERRSINRPTNIEARLRYEGRVPSELAALGIHVDFDTGLIGRKPIKRCHKCYDTNHDEKMCPYKRSQDRTLEVQAEIKRRYEMFKAHEYNDPLLSKKYKERHYPTYPRKEKPEKRKKKSKKQRKKLRHLGKVKVPIVPIMKMSANARSTCYNEETSHDYLSWKQIKGPNNTKF